MALNSFDFLVILILLLGVGLGAVRKVGQQILGLISAWLALIICLWLYIPFSRRVLLGLFAKGGSGAASYTSVFDTVSFFIILFLFAVGIQVVFIQATKSPEAKRDTTGKTFVEKAEEKAPVKFFNIFMGLIVGFVVTVVWLSILMAPLRLVIISAPIRNSLINGLQATMASSALMPFFQQVLTWIYLSIRLFTPATGLPPIFSGFIG